ncbi:hypothetical protein DENSPDRAFT_854866 [Dentipellis sp. KUC8613]|nr:hypothetical protein DENSPDRAFT_854866 [Dentipellis sp. KUC8613]
MTASTFGQLQYSIPPPNLAAHGAFEFVNPDPGASFAPHTEQFPLRSRPLENVHLGVAQVPPRGTCDVPDLYSMGIGSSSRQQYHPDVSAISYLPQAPDRLPLQWSSETIPFGSAASPTVPRSYWLPDDGPRYGPPANAPLVAVEPANMHGGYFPQAMAPLGAQPPTQAYPMPGYGEGPPHGGLNATNVPYGTFQPDQQTDPGRMDTSLRQTSR